MKRIVWNELDSNARDACLARPGAGDQQEVEHAVRRVFDQVRADGDTALRALTRRFDGVELAQLIVDADEIAAAERTVAPSLRAALVQARERLLAWHFRATGTVEAMATAVVDG